MKKSASAKKTSAKQTTAEKQTTSAKKTSEENKINSDQPIFSSKKGKEENEQGDFHDMFVDMLDDIYWAEKHLVKKLPAAGRAATSEELYKAVQEHLAVTKTHVSRLEQVFESINEEAKAKKCDAMEGLSEEVDSMIEDTEDGSLTRDAGLIVCLQKVEHYEIASYGGLCSIAKTLGYTEAASLLQQTLDEEKEADTKLTELAETTINEGAMQE